MSISKLEQETIIGFNEAEATASVYTHNAALVRKLEALADSRPDEVQRARSFSDGGRFTPMSSARQWRSAQSGLKAPSLHKRHDGGRGFESEREEADNFHDKI